jgi:hypothetical protein
MHCGQEFLSVYNENFTIVLMWNKGDYRDFGKEKWKNGKRKM